MGENGVYRKQFYTKLVSSCHFMFLYLHIYIYIYMQLFPLLRKTREVHKSNACLVLHRVIRSSPSNSSFPLTCGFITAVRNASLL